MSETRPEECLRLKSSKRTSKCQLFASTVPKDSKRDRTGTQKGDFSTSILMQNRFKKCECVTLWRHLKSLTVPKGRPLVSSGFVYYPKKEQQL